MKTQYFKEDSGVIKMNTKQTFVPKEQSLFDFMLQFVNENNIPLDELSVLEGTTTYYVYYEKKLYQGKQFSKQINIINESYILRFIPVMENMIELYLIEVFDRGKGTGTQLMNDILDVSDELGIGVKVIPIGFREESMKIIRLREWYKSFGFEPTRILKKPDLFYISDSQSNFSQAA